MTRKEHRIAYVRYAIWFLEKDPSIWDGLGYESFKDFVQTASHIQIFLENYAPEFCITIGSQMESITKSISKALQGERCPREDTIENMHNAFSLPLSFRDVVDRLKRKDPDFLIFLNGPPDDSIPINFDKLDRKRSESAFSKKSKGETIDKKFIGYYFVDRKFIDTIKIEGSLYSESDFFTSNPNSQWIGVVNRWDAERRIYHKFRTTVIKSYSHKLPISAVLIGDHGNGKATFFRRIACSLISPTLDIIWITDITSFYGKLSSLTPDQQCLLIVDNWEKIKGNERTNELFFNYVFNSQNIKIILSDTLNNNNDYLRWFSKNNCFYVNGDDDDVVYKIVSNDKFEFDTLGGDSIYELIWKWDDFGIGNHLPLSVRLFILFVECEKHRGSKNIDLQTSTSYIASLTFQKLIKIKELVPGACRMIYLSACLYRDYQISISWKVFALLSKHYNLGNEISHDFFFPREDPLSLSADLGYFFYIDYSSVADDAVVFHSDYIANEILCEPVDRRWTFDLKTKKKIVNFLLEKKLVKEAFELFLLFWSYRNDVSGISLLRSPHHERRYKYFMGYEEVFYSIFKLDMCPILNFYISLNDLHFQNRVIEEDQYLKNLIFFKICQGKFVFQNRLLSVLIYIKLWNLKKTNTFNPKIHLIKVWRSLSRPEKFIVKKMEHFFF
jgi:hypothetical protein